MKIVPVVLIINTFILISKASLSPDSEFLDNYSNFSEVTCRTERQDELPFDFYRMDTCARCYLYTPEYTFVSKKLSYDVESGLLYDLNSSYIADPQNVHPAISSTFMTNDLALRWKDCCIAAVECCLKMHNDPPTSKDTIICPRTWDGWACWPDTIAGEVGTSPCRDHIYINSEPPPCQTYAKKTCWDNGTWYLLDGTKEWSNYSDCVRVEGIQRLQYFKMATHAVSIAFLFPALVIFFTYKQLQVYRITMHKNLFVALLLNAVSNIIFMAVVVCDEIKDIDRHRITILEANGVMCKILSLMTKYTRMTTYMWMFCEGFYLHKLIAAAFAEQKSLKMYYLIGWIFPAFPVATYAMLRWKFADEKCWAFSVGPYEWVTNSPNMLSLILNLIFLCNIIRVLVTKLRAAHANEPSQFRKAVRATLVLVPLFGLHFVLFIYKPKRWECPAYEGYKFFSDAMDGLQGFIVSLIFCYLNGEVTELLRRSTYRLRLRYGNVRATSVTQFSNMSDMSIVVSRHSLETTTTNASRRWRKSNAKDENGEDNGISMETQPLDPSSKPPGSPTSNNVETTAV